LSRARKIVADEIRAIDAACNRFSAGSELSRLNRSDGAWTTVSSLLGEALEVALVAAERTDGAVDPTVGRALEVLGYDRDYDEVAAGDPALPLGGTPAPAGGWWNVGLHPSGRAARVPRGLHLDLGATAKALCVDRAAERAAGALGAGVLVAIGGDVAAAGPAPAGGWRMAVVEDVRSPGPGVDCVVAVRAGGVASSGTTARAWIRAGMALHHVIDPSTGWPASSAWRMVTVAAPSCVQANTAATAAVVWGEEALFRLPQLGLSARLVRTDGAVLELGGWPRAGDREDQGSGDQGSFATRAGAARAGAARAGAARAGAARAGA